VTRSSRIFWMTIVALGLMPILPGCGGGASREDVPQLVQHLTENDSTARYAALKSLGDYGPKAKEAVPAMMTLVKDPSDTVRVGAVYALGKIGPAAAAAVPALAAALEDPDKEVRAGAAYSLPALGPQSAEAWTALQRAAARDSDPEVRQVAAKAMTKIQTIYKYRQAAEAAAAASHGGRQ
jgi:HEAT repeat protein